MKRFLLPREHGAYAQLTFPLLSGLLAGGGNAGARALAASAVLLFLAYEPVVVLRGTRGVRLQRDAGRTAGRQLSVLAPAALLLGATALVLLPAHARALVIVPGALGALLLPLVLTRRVKTLAGETLVLAAFASLHLPLAAAGGASGVRLWVPPLVWFTGFFLATLAVHAIKARQKQRDAWIGTAALASSLAFAGAAAAAAVALPSLRIAAGALVLPVLAVIGVNVAHLHPRALKRVGWTLVAANTLALIVLAQL